MSTNRKAVYPGTFDPITRGHEDLVRRAAGIFDSVLVAIAANPGKAPLFDIEERVALARGVLKEMPNVSVMGYTGLTVEFARAQGIGVIVRGLRAVSDFEFEFKLANMGRHIAPGRGNRVPDAEGALHVHLLHLVREIAMPGRQRRRFRASARSRRRSAAR